MAQARDTLVDRLKATRAGYKDELVWHRFLLDAYTGCGGFAGKVKPPASDYLGWAAEIYSSALALVGGSDVIRDTYLDRFPREDEPKFDRRCDVAHYVNYTGPICDLFVSYLSAQQATREGISEGGSVAKWMQDADGRGTSWDELKTAVVVPRALQLGWCPVLFDKDPAPQGVEVKTKAQEQELKLRTRAVPLFPAQILAWQTDDAGALLWVKIRLDYCEQPDALAAETQYTKVQVWTRETVAVYRIDRAENGQETASTVTPEAPHNLGAVPLIVFRAGQAPDDPIKGISIIGAVAVENRRHFNLLSELDEHLRSTVFALLQVPIPPGHDAPDELLGGSGNAVPVPSDAHQGYEFIAPPQSVAETYERRLKATEREIYRVSSAPYDNDSGAAQSGVSRAYQFEGTNKRLVKIVGGLASAEQRGLQLVAKQSGDEAAADKIRVTPPQDFRIDDLAVDLDNLIKAVSVAGMSATAKMLLVLRNVVNLLPNMQASDRKLIEAELAATRDRELKAAESAPTTPIGTPVPGADGGADGGDDDPDDGEDEEGAGDEAGSQAAA